MLGPCHPKDGGLDRGGSWLGYHPTSTCHRNGTTDAQQATNHAAKYLAANNLAAAKDLASSDENRDALVPHYKNLPPPSISPCDESRDADYDMDFTDSRWHHCQ